MIDVRLSTRRAERLGEARVSPGSWSDSFFRLGADDDTSGRAELADRNLLVS